MSAARIATARDAEAMLLFDPVARKEPQRAQLIREAIEAGEAHVRDEAGTISAFGIINYHFFGCGFVELLVVHPEFRRCGLGSGMMRYLEGVCSHRKLFTSTNKSNVPMRRMLAKIGYERSGIVYNLDDNDPELIYYKQLA